MILRTESQGIRREFVRYLFVGGVAFLADYGLLVLLFSGLAVPYLLATLIAFLFGAWINYQLSIRCVFSYRAVNSREVEFGFFLLIGVITLGLSLLLMALLVEILGLHVLVSKVLVTAFTLVANFAGRRALLFTRWGRATNLAASPLRR